MHYGLVLTVVALLALAVGASAQDAAPPAFGPRAPWPQSTPTAPFVNAADFSPPRASADKMATPVFGENPDATDALQAALDAGAGGVVFIPAGCYRVTRPLRIQTGTTLMGAGYCATVLLTEKAIPAILHAKGVGGPMTIIRDLWVCGPVGGNWEAAGIWLEGCNGITVHDCWVSALQTGIKVDGISDTWLRSIVFELNQHGIVVDGGELGWASGNLRMLDCYGYQNYQTGVTIANCRGVQMEACSSVGSGTGASLTHCAQVTITGYQINWDGSPWRKFGLRLDDCEHVALGSSVVEGMVDYGIAAVGCKRLTMTGNVVRHTTAGPGIIVEDCQNSSIVASNVSESAGDGMTVSACRRVALSANVADTFGQDPARAAEAVGIRIAEDCTDCQLSANIQ